MREANTISKKTFVFESAFWMVIAIVWYRNTVFKCVVRCTLLTSEIIFYVLLFVLSIIGMLLTISKRRNGLSIFVNIMLPIEIYTIIAFGKDMTLLSVVSVSFSLLAAILFFVLCVTRKIQNKIQKKQIVWRRIKYGFLGSRTTIAICMLIIMIPLEATALLGGTIAFKQTAAKSPTTKSECTIASNIDIVSNIREDKWKTLNLNEKTNLLQTIANIEVYHLGLPHELNVKVGVLKKLTIAQYDDDKHTITFNTLHLDSLSAGEALESICHESFHAFQYCLCEVYDSVEKKYQKLITFNNVQSYKNEFLDYENGNDDLLGYYFQKCEILAREYAADSVANYYDTIDKYISTDGDNDKTV